METGTFFRIEAKGQKIGCSLHRSLGKQVAVVNAGEGMQIDNEDIEIRVLHLRNHCLHHTEIVADMQFSRRLDTR